MLALERNASPLRMTNHKRIPSKRLDVSRTDSPAQRALLRATSIDSRSDIHDLGLPKLRRHERVFLRCRRSAKVTIHGARAIGQQTESPQATVAHKDAQQHKGDDQYEERNGCAEGVQSVSIACRASCAQRVISAHLQRLHRLQH